MALGLAFRRTARFYAPPLRRWFVRNEPYLFVWLLGLCTGLYVAPVDHDRVTALMLGGFAGLTLLKKWAGDESPPTSAQRKH